jgi:2-amino-4-hydroxy-6-hydroxymethyldihydropteridine diphosphokinase
MSHDTWTPAYIGVGSNLDDPQAQVTRGIDALAGLGGVKLIAQSKLYRTAPLGPQDQPHYINAAVGVLTQLDAPTLLARLKTLEQQLGKTRPVVRWGPRIIDFDLLAFGSARIDSDDLKVPHPGVAERGFVLKPLLDVAPDLNIPGCGSVRALASKASMQGVEPVNG